MKFHKCTVTWNSMADFDTIFSEELSSPSNTLILHKAAFWTLFNMKCGSLIPNGYYNDNPWIPDLLK